jgi:hypothetical protein
MVPEMAKFFISKELAELVYFHSADLDWDNFNLNHIPKTHMPKDYFGDLESVEILHEKSYEKMLTLEDYFKAEEKLIYDPQDEEDDDRDQD